MQIEFGVRFIFTVATTLAYMEAPVIYMALKCNLELPWIMSFDLAPHLPRLVAMAALFSMCERKVSKLIYYFSVFYIFLFQLTTKADSKRC